LKLQSLRRFGAAGWGGGWKVDVALAAFIGLVTVVIGIVNQAFVGFPKGFDAYGHMSKIKFLVDYFPHINWNYEWYSGMLYSEGSFPPLFHYLGALLVGTLSVSLAASLLLISAASFIVIAWGLYGMVRVATGDPIAGLIAALVLNSSSAYWNYILEAGLYPRILGMAFLALFAFFATLYFRRGGVWLFVAMVLSLAGTLSSHLLLGIIGVAFALLVLASLPLSPTRRVLEAAKLLIPCSLLVAYFYLPWVLALGRPTSVPLLTREYAPLSLSALLVPGTPGGAFESLPFFMVPAAVVLLLLAYNRGRLPRQPIARRLLVVLAIASATSLVYAFVGLPAPHLFLYAFQPGQALFFATWFLAALCGVALSGMRLPKAQLAGIVALLLVFILVTAPDSARGAVTSDSTYKREIQAALQIGSVDRQYRVGVGWDGGSDWINSSVDVPQTRGYQQQGVLHPDWQYWFEQTVWNPKQNYVPTDFLLDWYGVKWLYGGPDPTLVQAFEARPDLYTPMAPSLPVGARTFEYRQASPILSARSTRTALVVGSDAAYTLIVKALALSGFDSLSLIPIKGGEYLDDHQTSELAQFSQVILYDFKAHDPARAFAMLAGYVRGGGSVVIEANNSPFEVADAAAEPIPGTEVSKVGIGPAWNFQASSSPILAGIDLGSFAPAAYQGGPWGVSYIPASAVQPWAQPVLLSGGRPVVVAGNLGLGRVVWSGMNLPYHIVTNAAAQESRLLAQEIAWAAPDNAVDPSYDATFVNPELRRITVTAFGTGVLFKENWFEDWHATINGKVANVYAAGPDFMYVPLGKNVQFPAHVELVFTPSAAEQVGNNISEAALSALIAYALTDVWRRRRRRTSDKEIRRPRR
jgi:hypothetical protein